MFKMSSHWLSTGFDSFRNGQWKARSAVFHLPWTFRAFYWYILAWLLWQPRLTKAYSFPFIYLLVDLFVLRKMNVLLPILECKLKFVEPSYNYSFLQLSIRFSKYYRKKNGHLHAAGKQGEDLTRGEARRKGRRLQLLLQGRDKPSLLDENENHSGCRQAAVLMLLHNRKWDWVLVLQRMPVVACLLARLLFHCCILFSCSQKIVWCGLGRQQEH